MTAVTGNKKERTAGIPNAIYQKKLLEQIEAITAQYNTSFNNVVVSMIEACLCDKEDV